MHVLADPTCNYYERGTISPPLYVSNMIKLQETAYMSRPICDPIQKELEGPTKDRPAY